MVQLNLPQNSKILKGKYYKDKTNSSNLKKVNIYRWEPSNDQNPRIDTFEVDMDNCGPKVLDILFKIKNEIEKKVGTFIYSGIEWRANTYLNINKAQSDSVIKVLEALDEDDDVQNIFVNCNLHAE